LIKRSHISNLGNGDVSSTIVKLIEGVQQPELQYMEDPHGYRWNGASKPYITGIIKDLGHTPDFSRCEPQKLARKTKIGKAFHLAARYFASGVLDPSWNDPLVAPYLDGLKKFAAESKAQPQAVEVSLYSRLHDFAGTVDSVWILNGSRAVIEYKTRDSHYSDEYQTWAQEMLWNEVFPSSSVMGRFTLHLSKDGSYRLKDWNNRIALNFTYLLWNWRENRKVGKPCHLSQA
jgi:hypothetical protein